MGPEKKQIPDLTGCLQNSAVLAEDFLPQGCIVIEGM